MVLIGTKDAQLLFHITCKSPEWYGLLDMGLVQSKKPVRKFKLPERVGQLCPTCRIWITRFNSRAK